MNYDTFEEIFDEIEDKIDRLEKAQYTLASVESSFKSYEASTKKAYMDAGMSAVAAEAEMRAVEERWRDFYLQVQEHSSRVEKIKRTIKLLEMRHDALRSAKADARRVV